MAKIEWKIRIRNWINSVLCFLGLHLWSEQSSMHEFGYSLYLKTCKRYWCTRLKGHQKTNDLDNPHNLKRLRQIVSFMKSSVGFDRTQIQPCDLKFIETAVEEQYKIYEKEDEELDKQTKRRK